MPVHYALAFTVAPEGQDGSDTGRFRARAKVVLEWRRDESVQSVRTLKLHSKNLEYGSVTANDSVAAKVTTGTDTIDVEFERELGRSSTPEGVVLDFEYTGVITDIRTPQDFTRGLFKTNFMGDESDRSDNVVFSTHCQPKFARLLFPCMDEPNVKSTFQLTLTTSKRYECISNTKIANVVDTNQKSKTVSFETTPKMITSLFTFTIGDLQRITTKVTSDMDPKNKGVEINVYAPWKINNAVYTLDVTKKYLPILEAYFQFPLPLNKVDFVLLPFLSDIAMENFGAISVQMNQLLLDSKELANPSRIAAAAQIVVHELVHQWIGNYISFDSWSHLWFNEAFATWCSSHLLDHHGELKNHWISPEFLEGQLVRSMYNDSDALQPSIKQMMHTATKEGFDYTSEIFQVHPYNKGIAILRAMQLTIGDYWLKKGFKAIFQDTEKFHSKSVKPIDIWAHIGNTLKSHNVPNFFATWVHLPGVPYVSIELKQTGPDSYETKFTQHRFLMNAPGEEIEDVPYHIPLLGILPDGSHDIKNVLMTDRSLTVPYAIALCNHDSQGYYFNSYETELSYIELAKLMASGKLTETDLSKIMGDLALVLGDKNYEKPVHYFGLFHLLESFAKSPNLDKFPELWTGVALGLDVIQSIHSSWLAFGAYTSHKLPFNYMNKIIKPLLNKIKWPIGDEWDNPQFKNPGKLKVMAQVLFLTKDTPTALQISGKYFDNILNGPKNSVPLELVNAVFTVMSTQCKDSQSFAQYLGITTSVESVVPNIMGLDTQEGSTSTLQSLALENMGFIKELSLIEQILDIVATSMEVEGNERALYGLTYHAREPVTGLKSKKKPKVRDIVWKWYAGHFDEWQRHTVKASPFFIKNLQSVTNMVLQMYLDAPDVMDSNLAKNKSFGPVVIAWDSIRTQDSARKDTFEGFMTFTQK